jgi:DNA-binding LacI/PurR family transcriptional regulator
MIDVARLAAVSQQTVSRVVNNSDNVGSAVRARVEEAIAQLDYRPNTAARALATRRSMNLGVISFGLAQYGPSVALFGIAEEARRHGYATNLVTLADVGRPAVRAAFEHLASTQVDGVVVLAPVRAALVALEDQVRRVPVVVFDPGNGHRGDFVATDEVRGARLATRHLLDLGHGTVWHVAGPEGWSGADARVRGWSEELSEAGAAVPPPVRGDWSSDSGYEAGLTLGRRPAVTAVFVANDQMALGLIDGLGAVGRRVPEDVSVVGFDDIPESRHFRPPLTTVQLDFDEVGRLCVDRILELMSDPHARRDVDMVQPTLVHRASTAPPPPGSAPTTTRGTNP